MNIRSKSVIQAATIVFAVLVLLTIGRFFPLPVPITSVYAQPSGNCQENLGAPPVITKAYISGAPLISASQVSGFFICADNGSGNFTWQQFYPVMPSGLDHGLIQAIPTVTITQTQVNALNATPVTLVPAQGAGTYIEPISLILENVFGSAAYAAGGAIGLYYTGPSGVLASSTAATTFLTGPVANQMILLTPALASNLSSGVINVPLVLSAASPAYTNAGTGGTMLIKLKYRIHAGL